MKAAIVILALLAASLAYAGEPKITVGDIKPNWKHTTSPQMSLWHHHPAPIPSPMWPGVWPVLGGWLWLK